MRLTMLALGSRGDVQPFVALGVAMQQRGHQVRVAAANDYHELVCDAGLAFAPIVGNIRDIMDFDLVYEALDAARNRLPVGFARRFLQHVSPLVGQIVADCLSAAQDADVLVASTLGMYPGVGIAEQLKLPIVPAHFHPFAPTRVFPDVSFAELPVWLPGRTAYNLLTHHLAAHGLAQLLRPAFDAARVGVLDLPPLGIPGQWRQTGNHSPLVLFGYSSLIAPRPFDWGSAQQITGFWFSQNDSAWQPPADLAAFLAGGPPPVYVGFGSILVGRHPDQVTALVLRALELAGQRGVLFRGWGDFAAGSLPDHVIAIDSAPHDWLFPRMAAVVTHGGAGTVAAALRAGVPPIVVPFFGDQRFWGKQLACLDLGPTPIPRAQLSAEALAAAIRSATSNSAVRRRVRAVGALLESEHGAERAAGLLEGMTG